MKGIITLTILGNNQKLLDLHLEGIKILVQNYMQNQAYDPYEYKVEVEKEPE